MAYRIIVIDDENEISKGFAQYFPWGSLGFTVVGQFTNAASALHYLASNPVDVIVSDVIMPGMTGIDLARELMTMSLDPQPLVILYSAHSEFEYARQALKFKCIDYIPKTTEFEELVMIFKRLKQQLDDQRESSVVEEEDKIIITIKEYIRQNPSLANLDGAAARVYMSPSYISRYFKQKTNSSFSDYVADQKMLLACELLLNLKYKIYEISSILGYTNPVNFSRSFRKRFGISPREYRFEKLGRVLPEDEEHV